MRLRLLALLLLAAPPARAEAPPACGPAERGRLACMAGRSCACRYEPGGSLTGTPGGWAWDCGVLRPDCRPPPPPAAQSAPDIFLAPRGWQGGADKQSRPRSGQGSR